MVTNFLDFTFRLISSGFLLVECTYRNPNPEMASLAIGFIVAMVLNVFIIKGSKEHSKGWLVFGSIVSALSIIFMCKMLAAPEGMSNGRFPIHFRDEIEVIYRAPWVNLIWESVVFVFTTIQLFLIENGHPRKQIEALAPVFKV